MINKTNITKYSYTYKYLLITMIMKQLYYSLISALFVVSSANAQTTQPLSEPFEAGKIYVAGSLSGLNLNYNSDDDFNLGVNAKFGIMIFDDVLAHAGISYDHNGSHSVPDNIDVGVGLRYYNVQNGLFMGLNGKYKHAKSDYNDFMLGLEAGWTYFLSRTATIEPSIYYDQSFRNHSDYSTLGFLIGFGLYF